MRRHKRLARDWTHRTLGRRTSLYFWIVYTAIVLLVLNTTTAHATLIGIVLGAIGMGFYVLPDMLLPDHIARWERGAWGEQNTAKALKPLRKQGWLIRHDLASGYANANRDHIAVGPAVYLLDSKLLKDRVWIKGGRLHVHRLDASGDKYDVEAPTRRMAAAAKSLNATSMPLSASPLPSTRSS
jgi:hypothetical protein